MLHGGSRLNLKEGLKVKNDSSLKDAKVDTKLWKPSNLCRHQKTKNTVCQKLLE